MVCGSGVVFGCRTKMTLMSTMCGQFQPGSTRSGHKLNSRLLAFYNPRSWQKSVVGVKYSIKVFRQLLEQFSGTSATNTEKMTGPCISVVHEETYKTRLKALVGDHFT